MKGGGADEDMEAELAKIFDDTGGAHGDLPVAQSAAPECERLGVPAAVAAASMSLSDLKTGPHVHSGSERAAWMSFTRACKNPKRCPASIAAQFKTGDLSVRSKLFNDWFYNGNDLAQLEVTYKRITTLKDTMRTRFSWKTSDDLLEQYHGKSEMVADLVRRKTGLGHVRAHPEFPSEPTMRQYYVLTDTTMCSDHSMTNEWEASMLAALDGASVAEVFAAPSLTNHGPLPGALLPPPAADAAGTAEVVPPAPTPKPKPSPKPSPHKVMSPFKKGGLLLKQMNKYAMSLKGLLMQFASMRYQSELKGKLEASSKRAEELFVECQSLLKQRVDEEDPYSVILAQFVRLQGDSRDDINEAEAVCAGANKPKKAAASKKTSPVKQES